MAKRKVDKAKGSTDNLPLRRRSTRHKASNDGQLPVTEKRTAAGGVTKGKRSPNVANGKLLKTKTGEGDKMKMPEPGISKLIASGLSNGDASRTRQYWLLKAEPESRLERGHDIKFSIDDLAAKTVPEPWDGIRAYPARNNLRTMRRGDLAFFYHSSCKIPAIVGVMEIVKEHSPDLSAQDPNAPYYDPKDMDSSNPKWSVVHVEFRRKLKEPITLRELRDFASKGGSLENMQMLKQSRLSVSGVSKDEWDFLMGVIEQREVNESQ